MRSVVCPAFLPLLAGEPLPSGKPLQQASHPLMRTFRNQPPPAVGASLTLTDALGRSQSANTAYAQAIADSKVADAQIGVARSTLLPGVVYHNQYLYTQPQHVGGKPAASGSSSPLFIANNAVHEYVSQGAVSETLSGTLAAGSPPVRGRGQPQPKRGWKWPVVASSPPLSSPGMARWRTKPRSQQPSRRSTKPVTSLPSPSQLEAGGEVAHSDVIKANFEVQQQQRDLNEARLQAEKSRIDLAILLFPNPLTPYTLSGSLAEIPDLPQRNAINAAAKNDNPDVKAALAAFKASQLEVTSAKLDYLPALIFNYSYGIDATQFTVTSSDGARNLGYQASVTLDIPVWDWFATRNKIRQSIARKDLAQTELTSTQRQLAASIEELYQEAQVAYDATKSLDISVQDATTALHLSELRYQSGEAPIYEIVDAQTTLITTQNNRIDSAARLKSALANLQTLTGNLP